MNVTLQDTHFSMIQRTPVLIDRVVNTWPTHLTKYTQKCKLTLKLKVAFLAVVYDQKSLYPTNNETCYGYRLCNAAG